MPRYINADTLIQEDFTEMWNDITDQSVFECIIEQTPTADVIEVKHGYWKKLPFGMRVCSECNYLIGRKKRFSKSNYCRNCGAKMDAKE